MSKKNKFCALIFTCLCRGIASLTKDTDINADIALFPIGFKINLGILPYGAYIQLINTEHGLKIANKPTDTANLTINFKSIRAAKSVMLARRNCAQSYARHELIVGGDITKAVTLVRIINKTEGYLFPRFMTRKILPKIKKQTPTLIVYAKLLFKNYKQKV